MNTVMEMQDLLKKSSADLQKMLAEKREELRALRFAVANLQNKNVRAIRVIRKEVARIQTALQQMQSTSTENSNTKEDKKDA